MENKRRRKKDDFLKRKLEKKGKIPKRRWLCLYCFAVSSETESSLFLESRNFWLARAATRGKRTKYKNEAKGGGRWRKTEGSRKRKTAVNWIFRNVSISRAWLSTVSKGFPPHKLDFYSAASYRQPERRRQNGGESRGLEKFEAPLLLAPRK